MERICRGLYARCSRLAIANGFEAIAMSNSVGSYSLRLVRTPQDWSAYHAIRRDSIFAPLLPGQTYDERDADEFKPGNLPHVLVRDGEVVGTVRIDLID